MGNFFSVEPFLGTFLLRFFVSLVCGIIIGLERASRAKPAGVRTHMLISTGCCLFMSVSLFVAEEARKMGFITPDPGRIAAQVVTGIGFLGAGAIITNKGLVRGMTSAATIWCMAAIGIAAGSGMLIVAVSVSFSIVFILRLFDLFEKRLRIKRFRVMSMDVTVKKEGRVPDIRHILRSMGITLSQERVSHLLGEVHYHANILFQGDMEEEIEKRLKKGKGIRDVIMLTPGELWDG